MDESEIGLIVMDAALAYFEKSGCKEDFCIQSIGSETVVFGGFNRLIWSVRNGFKPDPSYCTERFLVGCQNIKVRHRRNDIGE